MARLGPFGAPPRLAVAVSGGADSTALALLTQAWVARHGGEMLALIVDHGLRPTSALEAALTGQRLAARGIAARVLTLTGLAGAGLQARARTARHAALAGAARAAGFLHLLYGHHADDQRETAAMRAARGAAGLEGMAAWRAGHDIIAVRPLLAVSAAALRTWLRAAAMPWVEDPSNADRRFERVRIRQDGAAMADTAAASAGRRARDLAAANFLARHAMLRPEGFAVIDAATAPPAALAALLRIIGGRDHPPARAPVAALAARRGPATLGGVRIAPAGRLGGGWLLAREPAGCAKPVPVAAGALWDHRFRILEAAGEGAELGALGPDAPSFRAAMPDLPALVLRGMPCLRRHGAVIAFPAPALFTPPAPACGHPFLA
jgi:tRNA(Ile)-lysidine synthase